MIRQDSLTILSLAAVIDLWEWRGDIENSFSSYNDCSKGKLRCVGKKIWKSKEPVLSSER